MNQLKLTVKKIDSTCDFELSWSGNKTLVAQIQYPQSLIDAHQNWYRAYFHYYKSLRVTAIAVTIMDSSQDFHRLLRDAHYNLITEFRKWLLSPELALIRQKIANIANRNRDRNLELFIACFPNELTRLPWEIWNLDREHNIERQIQITRTTVNSVAGIKSHFRVAKPRILAIIGYDPQLDFSQDRMTINSLSKLADLEFIDRQSCHKYANFSQAIFDKITDDNGWDILFFIGHSNEANWGGQFHLTPDLVLKTEDIKNSLSKAAENGLQLAIFNSCSGIDIAEYLIELGLSQVLIMREPVNNKVASQFLTEFVNNLADYQDTQTSLNKACNYFKQEQVQQQYPSIHLIPSLYRHPESKLFQFQNWSLRFRKWLPNRQQSKLLFVLLLLSLLSPVQDLLLETRLFIQLLYRQSTKQLYRSQQAPTLLIQIDEQSLTEKNLPRSSREEIDRRYLAELIDKIARNNTSRQVIGLDYKLWEPKGAEDDILKQAIKRAKKRNLQFVFANSLDERKTTIPEIANPEQSLFGDIYFYPGYLELPKSKDNCHNSCPFAYVLASANLQQHSNPSSFSTPKLAQTNTKLIGQNISYNDSAGKIAFLDRLKLHPITSWSQNLAQMWFHPILDYSIQPQQIYRAIPARCFLATNLNSETNSPCKPSNNWQQKIVIIAAGGYEGADDNFPMPISLQFTNQMSGSFLTGGEIHAYMVHHLLNRHLVTPIPDFLAILLFAILAQGIVLHLHPSQRLKWISLIAAGNIIYSFVCWQLYISLQIIIPLMLPSVLLWNYIRLSNIKERI